MSGDGTSRRDVMKAVGTGAALTVVGGAGAAAMSDDSAGNSQMTQETAETGSVYTVQTLIGPPTR